MGLQDPNRALTRVAPLETVVYELEITDLSRHALNCRSRRDRVRLATDGCILQNVLTPNGDGINDVLFLGRFDGVVSLAIFDRWGERVFQTGNYANDWSGGHLPDGVYYYVLKVAGAGGRDLVGNFALLR